MDGALPMADDGNADDGEDSKCKDTDEWCFVGRGTCQTCDRLSEYIY